MNNSLLPITISTPSFTPMYPEYGFLLCSAVTFMLTLFIMSKMLVSKIQKTKNLCVRLEAQLESLRRENVILKNRAESADEHYGLHSEKFSRLVREMRRDCMGYMQKVQEEIFSELEKLSAGLDGAHSDYSYLEYKIKKACTEVEILSERLEEITDNHTSFTRKYEDDIAIDAHYLENSLNGIRGSIFRLNERVDAWGTDFSSKHANEVNEKLRVVRDLIDNLSIRVDVQETNFLEEKTQTQNELQMVRDTLLELRDKFTSLSHVHNNNIVNIHSMISDLQKEKASQVRETVEPDQDSSESSNESVLPENYDAPDALRLFSLNDVSENLLSEIYQALSGRETRDKKIMAEFILNNINRLTVKNFIAIIKNLGAQTRFKMYSGKYCGSAQWHEYKKFFEENVIV